MIKTITRNLVTVAALQVATAASAGMITDSEGSNTSGINDATMTAQFAGSVSAANPLTIFGWVASNNKNDVDFYEFSVSAASQELFFDIDFAEDLAQTGDDDRGLDTALYVFDSTGTLIAVNDDSDFFQIGAANAGTDPGSDRFADHDSFIGGLTLANGTYYAALAFYGNEANALYQAISYLPLSISGDEIAGATADDSFVGALECVDDLDQDDPAGRCTGQYQLQIRTTFNDVPEPYSLALAGIGLVGICLRRRFTPRQKV